MPPLVSELKEKKSENLAGFGKTLPGCLTFCTEIPCTKSKSAIKQRGIFPAKHSRHSAFYGFLWHIYDRLSGLPVKLKCYSVMAAGCRPLTNSKIAALETWPMHCAAWLNVKQFMRIFPFQFNRLIVDIFYL
jgi:hypothetical protein